MKLKNKIVIVTGANGGIGSAIKSKLVEAGAKVIPVSKADADFCSDKSLLNLVNNIKNKQKKIDILINCAGLGIYKDIKNSTVAEWDQSFAINVKSPYFLTKELLPILSKSSDSLVINIGSGAGTIPMRGRSIYCATKFALRGWTLSLAEEYKGKLPKFCLITLGSTLTNFGGKTIEEKQKEAEKGRAYFHPDWVANRLLEIIKNDNRETEIILFPGDHGFGIWKKP